MARVWPCARELTHLRDDALGLLLHLGSEHVEPDLAPPHFERQAGRDHDRQVVHAHAVPDDEVIVEALALREHRGTRTHSLARVDASACFSND